MSVQECVCVFAQVPKKFSSVYNMCLFLRVNASGSPLENRAAPQSASLFLITSVTKRGSRRQQEHSSYDEAVAF